MNKADILLNAHKAVSGDRSKTHGSAFENMRHTANLWNAYLDGRKVITPLDVAHMMILHKQSRAMQGQSGFDDHYIDQCGYAAIAGEIAGIEAAHDEKKAAMADALSRATELTGREPEGQPTSLTELQSVLDKPSKRVIAKPKAPVIEYNRRVDIITAVGSPDVGFRVDDKILPLEIGHVVNVKDEERDFNVIGFRGDNTPSKQLEVQIEAPNPPYRMFVVAPGDILDVKLP